MLKELHSIKPFRGGDLGIIRLDNLAHPDKKSIKITIGGEEFKPIGFDTYGHPIISKENFAYYKALKAIAERKGESLVPVIEYERKPFCIRREEYDSIEGIRKALNKLEDFKKLLIMRKQAAFCKMELDTFAVWGTYVLASDGHIYSLSEIITNQPSSKKVIHIDETEKLTWKEEVHIPSEEDVCAICGKGFSIRDVSDFEISENEECRKVHKKCMEKSIEAINYAKASKIIDAVYFEDNKPTSEIGEIYDSEDDEMKTCYTYKTKQGTISIYFRTKVTVIVWHDNFKPFNMSIFDNERVTKFDRGIHAWSIDGSIDDAIKYLQMAKKA